MQILHTYIRISTRSVHFVKSKNKSAFAFEVIHQRMCICDIRNTSARKSFWNCWHIQSSCIHKYQMWMGARNWERERQSGREFHLIKVIFDAMQCIRITESMMCEHLDCKCSNQQQIYLKDTCTWTILVLNVKMMPFSEHESNVVKYFLKTTMMTTYKLHIRSKCPLSFKCPIWSVRYLIKFV